jgi:BlaI family penicillinase repressor
VLLPWTATQWRIDLVEPRKPTVSESERDVLKALWDHGPRTVREVAGLLRESGRDWAYTTVMTLLGRLEAKGYVTSDKSGFAHVFHAAVSRDDVVQQRLEALAEEFCDGEPAPLVLALVQGQRFTAEELAEFRRLIDELEKKRPKGKKK